MNLELLSAMEAPLAVLHDRWRYHSQPTRILAGLSFRDVLMPEAGGADVLPSLRPAFVETEDAIFPGANNGAGNTPIVTTITATYRFQYRQEYGLVSILDGGETAVAAKGAVFWLSKIMDAAETKSDGTDTKDARLNDTLGAPLRFSVASNEQTQLAGHLLVEVTLPLRSSCRGYRGKLFVLGE